MATPASNGGMGTVGIGADLSNRGFHFQARGARYTRRRWEWSTERFSHNATVQDSRFELLVIPSIRSKVHERIGIES